jgi:hypothetical protein
MRSNYTLDSALARIVRSKVVALHLLSGSKS